MPRRINKKCVECPQLSTDEAKQVREQFQLVMSQFLCQGRVTSHPVTLPFKTGHARFRASGSSIARLLSSVPLNVARR